MIDQRERERENELPSFQKLELKAFEEQQGLHDASSASSLHDGSYGSRPCCPPYDGGLPRRPPPPCSGSAAPRSWRWVSETWFSVGGGIEDRRVGERE